MSCVGRFIDAAWEDRPASVFSIAERSLQYFIVHMIPLVIMMRPFIIALLDEYVKPHNKSIAYGRGLTSIEYPVLP